MKILHVSTNGRRGGAGQAAWRLHLQLCAAGISSRMLTLDNEDHDPGLVHVRLPTDGGDNRAQSFRELFITANRTPASDTWFSAELEGFDLSRHPALRDADLIHLHWVSGLLSAPHIAQLLATGKPLVWTLHDMAPFTGGCHYSAGCDGFTTGCARCPQLAALSDALASAQWADKRTLWQGGRLGVVALNQWMADLAARAPIFAGRNITVVPNGVDLEHFHPRAREAQRRTLDLSPETIALLFVAESFREKRKGFATLAAALEIVAREEAGRQAARHGRLVFLAAGRGDLPDAALPIRLLGWCDEAQLAKYYAAADAFLLPSLEDNQPNTVVESLACGTPVIGSTVGGVPEMVTEGKTGFLVPSGDAAALARTILNILARPAALSALRSSCREAAEQGYDGRKNSRKVMDLYRQLVAAPGQPTAGAVSFPGPRLSAFLQQPRSETLGRPPSTLLSGRGSIAAQLEAEFDTHLKELQQLYVTADSLKNERNLLQAQLADLRSNFDAAEKDRVARGEVIEQQSQEQARLHQQIDLRLKELHQLQVSAEALRNERNLLAAQLADLRSNFDAAEKDRVARGEVIEQQSQEQARLHQQIDLRLKELHQLQTSAEALLNERNLLQAQLADLQHNFAAAEADRIARGEVIEQQGRNSAELHHLVWLTEQNRDWWKAQAEQRSKEADEVQRALRSSVDTLEEKLTSREGELSAIRRDLQRHLCSIEELHNRWWFRLARRLGMQ